MKMIIEETVVRENLTTEVARGSPIKAVRTEIQERTSEMKSQETEL